MLCQQNNPHLAQFSVCFSKQRQNGIKVLRHCGLDTMEAKLFPTWQTMYMRALVVWDVSQLVQNANSIAELEINVLNLLILHAFSSFKVFVKYLQILC